MLSYFTDWDNLYLIWRIVAWTNYEQATKNISLKSWQLSLVTFLPINPLNYRLWLMQSYKKWDKSKTLRTTMKHYFINKNFPNLAISQTDFKRKISQIKFITPLHEKSLEMTSLQVPPGLIHIKMSTKVLEIHKFKLQGQKASPL